MGNLDCIDTNWEKIDGVDKVKQAKADVANELVETLLSNPMVELASKIGFVESGDMIWLRMEIISIMKAGGDEKALLKKYEILAKGELKKNKEGTAQIGYNILEASIYLDWWDMWKFKNEINDVLDYVENMWYDDIADEVVQNMNSILKA